VKYPVRRFKNLGVGLKELEPFVRDGQHLLTGKPFKRLGGMRSREALANWLICAAINFEQKSERLSFTSDPVGGDGIIFDSETKSTWVTEHVLVPRPRPNESAKNPKDIGTRILEAVALKKGKGGAAYASGKQLVVFLDTEGGPWFPNRVARELPEKLDFDDVWLVALQGVEEGEYVYNVVELAASEGQTS
jgi:hypothetical protein